MQKEHLLSTILACALFLTACGGGGGSNSQNTSTGTTNIETKQTSAAPIPLSNDFDTITNNNDASINLTGYSSGIWDHHDLSVCWMSMPTAEAHYRELAKQAVESTWEKHTSIDFTGWGLCNNNNPANIKIRVQDIVGDPPSVNGGLGKHMRDMDLNFTFQNWNKGSYCDPIGGGEGETGREYCIRAIAIHEFGHAIGMAHEHNRPDTPDSCTEAPQGTVGDIDIGRWDADSVMNYCTPDYMDQLSQGDIEHIQRFYPALDFRQTQLYRTEDYAECSPGTYNHKADGYSYTCSYVSDYNLGLLQYKRYKRNANGEIDISSEQIKHIWGNTSLNKKQCYHTYGNLKKQDLPKNLSIYDFGHLYIDLCKTDNPQYKFVHYDNDYPRSNNTHTYRYTDSKKRPFVQFEQEQFDKNDNKIAVWNIFNAHDTNRKPSWVVSKTIPTSNTNFVSSLYDLGNKSLPFKCIYRDAVPIYENEAGYNDCEAKVKKDYYSNFRPMPADLLDFAW